MKRPLIFRADSYKYSQHKATDPASENFYSYMEARVGARYRETLWFGLQYYLKKYLSGRVVTYADVDKADEFFGKHFGRNDVFNRDGWHGIVKDHNGNLPLLIKSVPEGTVVPISNVLMTIEATDDKYRWLVKFVETLLMKVWYPTTVATQSMYIRRKMLETLGKSGTPAAIDFKVHDFGYRGVTSEEQADLGGAAHLLSFSGTDTIAGIMMLMEYYSADVCGFSIPATEHSDMCSFGRSNEIGAFDNFLTKAFPTGMVAAVGDTYDVMAAAKDIVGTALREKILYRDGAFVFRPDSGDFFVTVPAILNVLWEKFGGSEKNGYKTLHKNIRVIQGDGMTPDTIRDLYNHINRLGWSSDNLTVGSGGGLLQKNIDRDTLCFAIKASAVKKNGIWEPIQKSPATDQSKKSKAGRLKLIKDDDGFKTASESEYGFDHLFPVFENGHLKNEFTLADIKANIAK